MPSNRPSADHTALHLSNRAQIKADAQGPLYAHLCEKLGWTPDAALTAELTAANEAELAKLDEQLKVRGFAGGRMDGSINRSIDSAD